MQKLLWVAAALAATATADDAVTVSLIASADAEIYEGTNMTNLGGRSEISIDLSSGGFESEAFLMFDLSPITDVTAATLELDITSGFPGYVHMYRMLQPWDEFNVTWLTFGGGVPTDDVVAASTPSFIIPGMSSGFIYELDVLTDVELWVAGTVPNYGWVFKTNSTNGWDFYTREVDPLFGSPPTLKVTDPDYLRESILQDGIDNEIRSNFPTIPIHLGPTITVDQSDGGVTQGLMKFNLTGITPVEEATLRITTTSSTIGTISAFRMIQSWNASATWSTFVDGIQADGIEAEERAAFTLITPMSGDVLMIDVTATVNDWIAGVLPNEGWVFDNDSTDGWDFFSFEATVSRPALILRSRAPLPTPMPTSIEGVATVDIPASVDVEIYAGSPTTSLEGADEISVDLSSGGLPSQALIKFDLSSIDPTMVTVMAAELEFAVTSPTSGTITAHRMIQSWNSSAVWADFDSGSSSGVVPDDVVADTAVSWTLVAPQGGTLTAIDVLSDVNAWLAGEPNEGWVLTTNSGDGWDFYTTESEVHQPIIKLTLRDGSLPSPTPAPVPFGDGALRLQCTCTTVL